MHSWSTPSLPSTKLAVERAGILPSFSTVSFGFHSLAESETWFCPWIFVAYFMFIICSCFPLLKPD